MYFRKPHVCSSWSCKKQTAVSHSRWNFTALGLWDVVTDVLEPQAQGNLMRPPQKQQQKQPRPAINLGSSFCSPYCVHTSRQRASLFNFEGNDAVITMTMKGQSPTVRLVSQTHRVDLDWLFDRAHLDRGIHFKYVNTSRQIADTLTKGSFSRERWS